MPTVNFKNLQRGSAVLVCRPRDLERGQSPVSEARVRTPTWTVQIAADVPVVFRIRHARFHTFQQTFTFPDESGYDVVINQVHNLMSQQEVAAESMSVVRARPTMVRLILTHAPESYVTCKDALTDKDYFVGMCYVSPVAIMVPRGRAVNIKAGRAGGVVDEMLGHAFDDDDNHAMICEIVGLPPERGHQVTPGRRAIQI